MFVGVGGVGVSVVAAVVVAAAVFVCDLTLQVYRSKSLIYCS